MKKIILVVFFCVGSLANAKDCKRQAEIATNGKCGKKACKFEAVEIVTDLSGYEDIKKDEVLFRLSEKIGRMFEVVVKKSSCKIITVNEIGSSDDEEGS